jgi:hypothetical protein
MPSALGIRPTEGQATDPGLPPHGRWRWPGVFPRLIGVVPILVLAGLVTYIAVSAATPCTLFSACPANSGTVSGILERNGIGPSTPLPGTVMLKATTNGSTWTHHVPGDGRFRMTVPQSTYKATALSPLVMSEDTEMMCSADNLVRVHAGATTQIVIACSIL